MDLGEECHAVIHATHVRCQHQTHAEVRDDLRGTIQVEDEQISATDASEQKSSLTPTIPPMHLSLEFQNGMR
jgi:hypothetical protein